MSEQSYLIPSSYTDTEKEDFVFEDVCITNIPKVKFLEKNSNEKTVNLYDLLTTNSDSDITDEDDFVFGDICISPKRKNEFLEKNSNEKTVNLHDLLTTNNDSDITDEDDFVFEDICISPKRKIKCSKSQLDAKKVAMLLEDDNKSQSMDKVMSSLKQGIGFKSNICAKCIVQQLDVAVYNGVLCIYNGIIWREVDQNQFRTIVREKMPELSDLSKNQFKEIYGNLLTMSGIKIDEKKSPSLKYQINFANGVYDIRSGKMAEHKKEDGFFSYIDVKINDYSGKEEYFENFVESTSNGDPNWRKRLLEIIGCVISNFNPKAFFVLQGATHSGKTQISNFLQALVGEDFCTSVNNLNDFAKDFNTAILFGKKLCIVPDVTSAVINSDAAAIIKSITGNNIIGGEQKYKDSFAFRNEASLVICTNYNIKVRGGADAAFKNRMVVLPFFHTVRSEDVIPDLYEKFIGEKEYIIKEALKALSGLLENNFVFSKVDFDDSDIIKPAEENDIVIKNFFNSCCIESPSDFVSTDELYNAYIDFALQQGELEINKIEFSRKFSAVSKTYGRMCEYTKSRGNRGYNNLRLVSKGNIFSENHNVME